MKELKAVLLRAQWSRESDMWVKVIGEWWEEGGGGVTLSLGGGVEAKGHSQTH